MIKLPLTASCRGNSVVPHKFLATAIAGLLCLAWSVCAQSQPVVTANPAPDSVVTNLARVTVTFTQPVRGVRAEDLLLNGSSSTNVVGTATTYTFSFRPPSPGMVETSWNGAHTITDLLTNRLDNIGANTTWQYTLLDVVPPTIIEINPVPGATVGHLTQIAVTFSEPVAGVAASSLLINGQPASQITGGGAGTYTFAFNAPAPGPVQLNWAANGGIHDLAPGANAFIGGGWSYTLHPGEFSGNVVINEFLAANICTNGLRDEDGELQDWIELHNRSTGSVNLNGWAVSDDPDQWDLWTLPAVTLAPDQYLIVFASGKDRRPTNGGNLHTSFKLSASGQYLGLFNANFPREVATQFLPNYPEQRPDISYGLYNDAFGYLTNPSPRAANSGPAAFSGFAASPSASVKSGFFNRPFSLSLSTATQGADIRYTLDGSEPTPTSGTLYTGPLSVAGSPRRAVVTVRAVAFRVDLLCSRVVTYSYVFPDYVLAQPANPEGFPASWITQTSEGSPDVTEVPADYQMDPRIITNANYTALVRQALTNLPTLSLVADTADLFSDSRGIYANPNPPLADRACWERPASAELILPDGSSGFRINAGLRIHGATSRDPNWTHKHSFRLFFKSEYDGKLNYPFFADSTVGTFKTLILTAGFNTSWNNRFEMGGNRAQFVRDQFCADLQLAMGHPASHGRFVHLYVNGLYWGVYNAHERPDDDFAATYLGGDKSQYDVVRNTQGFFEVVAGNVDAWSAMLSLVNGGLSDNSQYEQLRQYLDVDAFIDYMLVNHYAGNTDWANHNWYAFRKRAPGAGYEFVMWDAEVTMKKVNEDVTGFNQTASPTMIHSFLRNNAEYRLRFADHVQRHFSNGGVLFVDSNHPAIDPANAQRNRPGTLYVGRSREIDQATVLESARWGDSTPARLDNPFTRNGDFLPELDWMSNTFFPQRSAVVLDQYRNELLYPALTSVTAPSFSQQGGNVVAGFNLTLSAPSGMIYFTTNGADPRVYGTGAVSPDALSYTGAPWVISCTTVIKARARSGDNWSPLNEATFSVAQPLLPLRITELMYKPLGGDAYEFLELQNLGGVALDLGGCSFAGISFIFPVGFTISPHAVIVLANGLNPSAFAARYPGVTVAGYYGDKLSNSGEQIKLTDLAGRTILSVNYSILNGWPVATNGCSLEINDPAGDPNDPANWRLSTAINGTPGTVSAVPTAGAVTINEIMAKNTGALANGGTFPDWIELANTNSVPVQLGGWSLSNDGNPRKFVFPSGTVINANGYLVVFCDSQAGAPGLHAGFALSAQGESLFLYDPQTNRIDAITFGLQLPNLSVGRVNGQWQLTTPTPNSANQTAPTASPSLLSINEWMANPLSGQADWVELYNASTLPVPLRGLYLGTTNALFQVTSLSFVPPSGFVQLFADENSGADHLDFKLPAAGGDIVLYDTFGTELDRVTYAPQLEGISQGRLPDGGVNIVSFPGSASPGTTNFVVSFSGPRLNEIMARNNSAIVNPWGEYSDWIELYNPGAAPYDLSGMSLSVGQSLPRQWMFPIGATIGAGGYLILWCDSAREASTNLQTNFNVGQSLDVNSGGVYLFSSAGQIVDYVEYGFQISNQSIGRSGTNWFLLATPTPGAANGPAATLGTSADLRFNEWMANPSNGDDWFEVYNLDAQPVDLAGLYLTDDPSIAGQTKFVIAPLSFIAGHAWAEWKADGSPSQGRNHLSFRLDGSGESLRLYGRDLSLIDAVDFGPQQIGVSQGRLPDGGNAIVSFLTTPTPGKGNYLPLTNVVINEVLTHTDPPLEDAIELANLAAAPVDISGWYLSDSQGELKKFRIPDGTIIPAGGFSVFYQYQFDPTPGTFPSFALDSAHGDTLYLSAVEAGGNLTGTRTAVQFGAAQNGFSFGRYTSSVGVEFVALSRRTFGSDSPGTISQFRTGTGLTNAYPSVGPVVINEVMYHPVGVVGTNLVESPDEEFVELYNLSTNSVSLFDPSFPTNRWQLSGGVDFTFPSAVVISAQGYAVVVSFDPIANPAALTAFRTRFGMGSNTVIFGPFKGRLSDSGDNLELYRPDSPSSAPDAGFVPHILVDRVNYGSTAPWPAAAAGGGASLQRRFTASFGNDPLNWKAEPATAGRTNEPVGIAPPLITTQPQDQVVMAGASVTLSVAASSSLPIAYRWQRNGMNLSGATNASLIFLDAQPNDSGSFQVWVSNAAGSICSRAATLSVLAPPVITVQPSCVSAALGSAVTLRVAATGSAPMEFQWYFNGAVLPGAVSSSLTLSEVDPTKAGMYQAVVSNAMGVAISQPATLTVSGVDSDADGIPDSWMIEHFGHSTGFAGDRSRAQDDVDGDGMTNLQEYLAGCDPWDPQSSLKLDGLMDAETRRPQFNFVAVSGIGYTIQYSDTPNSAAWHKLYDVPADPATRRVTVNDSAATTVAIRFYRVVTPIQP